LGVVHIVAEAIVFFAAILLIYYFFQITQALGDRKKNIRYLIISAVVLFIAYPVSNLSGKKTVNPSTQISDQVRKVQKKHKEKKESEKKESEQKSSSSAKSQSESK
jgi:amino acid permease